MSNNSSSPPQFDVATAALEHLELLNRSNANPLEIAAQFRTLLRSKKARANNGNNKNDTSPISSNIDYTYMDYVAADATHRRRARSRGRADRRSKSCGRIQYDLDEDDNNVNFNEIDDTQEQSSGQHEQQLRSTIDDVPSGRHGTIVTTNSSARAFLPESHSCFGLSKWHDDGDSSTEDIYADSAVGSDYSEPPVHFAFPSSKAVSCDSAISGVSSSHKPYSSSNSSAYDHTSPPSASLLISPSKHHNHHGYGNVNLSQIDESSEQSTTSMDRFLAISATSSTNSYYPTINWKQLREKQHGQSLDKAKTFVSTIGPKKPTLTTTTAVASATAISPISLLNYHKHQPHFQKRIEQFNSTSNRPSRPRAITADIGQALQASSAMTTSSLTTVSVMSSATTPSEAESFTYPNVSELRRNFEQAARNLPISVKTSASSPPPPELSSSPVPSLISTGGTRSSSSSSSNSASRSSSSSSRSSNEIRTPSISPSHSPRPSYTISRFNASSMNNNEDVLVPLADCGLVIKHKATAGPKKGAGHHHYRRASSPPPLGHVNHLSNSMYSISSGYTEEPHLSAVCNENELLGGSSEDAVFV